jgi:hypothetical protein
VVVADPLPAGGRGLGGVVAVEPLRHVEEIGLLRPEQPRQGPPLHEPLVGRGLRRADRRVEGIGLRLPLGDDPIDVGEGAVEATG